MASTEMTSVVENESGPDQEEDMSDSPVSRLLPSNSSPPTYGSSPFAKPQSKKKSLRERLNIPDLRHLSSFLLFWRRGEGKVPRNRRIEVNHHEMNQRFCSNRISTTKYNLLTFFPRFLFDQFRRLANLFFLVIALLQQIPGVSPTGRFTTAVPLFLILLATAVKEIIEDVRRYRADNRVNTRRVYVLRNGQWHSIPWTKVMVGDIVRVENHQFFPADLLFLSSSEPQGLCYVETANLDGETNLKIRQAHPYTIELTTVEDISQLMGYVECEGPNNRLYEFTGNICVSNKRLEPIQPDQILLRGAQLRNTEWVHGLVVYTGSDTKLVRNATKTPLKRSNMDRVTNRQVILLFIVLLVLSLASTIGATVWNKINGPGHWYLQLDTDEDKTEILDFFKSILTFIILYNNLIPISLIVTLEVVKLIQAYFINFDVAMYDESTDTPALARNSNLNEELGQVKYIFSDKTGTLTENIMEFKKCSIAGQMYGVDPTSSMEEQYPVIGLEQALQGLRDHSHTTILQFFRVLSLCHTVIPERTGDSEEVVYQASSPDEGALVRAAREIGVVFKIRTPKSVIIEVNGSQEEYELLNLLEFNSTRKRMSVIVRLPDGTIKLFCKGADSVIYDRLVPTDEYANTTNKHLESFGVEGLRTLCVAERTIDQAQYQEWNKIYYAASTHMCKEEKERKLDEAAELIETHLQLLGATGIEDKLQEKVPESIAALKAANIKIWVLTGDKQETAINIGYASRQLVKGMHIMVVNESTVGEVKRRISSYITQLGRRKRSKEHNAALVIDGKSLTHALESSVQEDFLTLALACKSVICCRVSPLQKADVVKLVRNKVRDSITLAIGDGANDVSMIQAAHVGVGISGREGLQATLASDYAISQFRFLCNLLLVHGAWNYNRLAKVILYSFYKNICLYVIEFWFAFLNGFSGQPLFERWTIGVYNLFFTSLPPLALGLFDQDVSYRRRLLKPQLYWASQENSAYNTKVFWKWIFWALLHSLILFCAVYFLLLHGLPFDNGKVFGLWYVGNTVYTSVVITVCLVAGLETEYWTWITHLFIWGSIIFWFVFLLVYSHFWPTFPLAVEMVGQDFKLFTSFTFYALFVLVPFISIFPYLLCKIVQKTLWPTDVDRERQLEIERSKTGKMDYDSLSDSSFSVSYTVSSSGSDVYGDGLDGTPHKALSYQGYERGYAFSQEDHGSTVKGTSIQRRELVRFYNTQQDHT